MNIFNINKEQLELLDLIEENDGELTPELEQRLAINKENCQDKAVAYGRMIRKWKFDTEIVDSEIKRLQAIKTATENRIESFKERVATAMVLHDIKRVEIPGMTLRLQTFESVEVLDEEAVPEEFKKTKTVTTVSVDKVKAKAVLKADETIEGLNLRRKETLIIK